MFVSGPLVNTPMQPHFRNSSPASILRSLRWAPEKICTLLELEVVVEVDARSDLPVGVFEAAVSEALKVRPVEFLEELSARALQLAHLPAVELLEEFMNRDIDLRDRVERAVAQRGDDPPLDDEDSRFDLRLVPRLTGSRRDHAGAVVPGELAVGRVQIRVETGVLIVQRW